MGGGGGGAITIIPDVVLKGNDLYLSFKERKNVITKIPIMSYFGYNRYDITISKA
jgi:hypothetical protein